MELRERAEERRRAALNRIDAQHQATLGQFFTPTKAADLVASMPAVDGLDGTVRILDPGAGTGSLAVAIAERLRRERPGLAVEITAVELDPAVVPYLAQTLDDLADELGAKTNIIVGDYITLATSRDPRVVGPFDLVILNPPYAKLGAAEPSRVATALTVVDVPNLYAAFWALAIESLAPTGQCVAIVPRSWANGTYFTAFRHWLLATLSLDTLHVFESRNTVFADTGVLQENVIVSGTRGARSEIVTLSASVDHNGGVKTKIVPMHVVVQPKDRHQFVRFTDGATTVPATARYTLADLGLKASTGKVVDFRNRQYIVDARRSGTVPIVYQANVRQGRIFHPQDRGKPQWFLAVESAASKQLVPAGNYVIVKRFSAKEERRRVVAGVWNGEGPVAFDNKTNYIHQRGTPLDPALAQGLMVWLNSTPLDEVFRTFSGHTQVNAGDLAVLPFPSREHLIALGLALPGTLPEQALIDKVVGRILGEFSQA